MGQNNTLVSIYVFRVVLAWQAETEIIRSEAENWNGGRKSAKQEREKSFLRVTRKI